MTRVTPSLRRSAASLLLVIVAALVLAGCASIPTSGPVNEGKAVAQAGGAIEVRANAPRQGADPLQIVEGFLGAQNAGPTSTFDTAREFLTDGYTTEWKPLDKVMVYRGGLGLTVDESAIDTGTTTVRGTAHTVGSVDGHGVYTEAATDTPVIFTLTRDKAGQWRIDAAADGLVMSQGYFMQFYQERTLYFPSADRTVLVPELRWFPNRNWQTYAVRETLVGPSPWLAGSVATVVPEGTALVPEAVPTDQSGPVLIQLNEVAASMTTTQRGLLVAQLQALLAPRTVEITAGQDPLVVNTVPRIKPAAVVGDPVVLGSDGKVMQLKGRALEPFPTLAPLTALNPTALAYFAGGPFVVRSGETTIVPAPKTGTAVEPPLVTGVDLVAPSVDRYSYVWTAEAVSGRVLAVDKDNQALVEVPWLAGRVIKALRVAPDGARLAVLSTGVGGVRVDVAGIVRNEQGLPTSVSEPFQVAMPVTSALALVWVDQTLLGALGLSDGETSPVVHLAPVGGPTRSTSSVEDARTLAAGSGVNTVLQGTADGTLYSYETTTLWDELAKGVRFPAYPG